MWHAAPHIERHVSWGWRKLYLPWLRIQRIPLYIQNLKTENTNNLVVFTQDIFAEIYSLRNADYYRGRWTVNICPWKGEIAAWKQSPWNLLRCHDLRHTTKIPSQKDCCLKTSLGGSFAMQRVGNLTRLRKGWTDRALQTNFVFGLVCLLTLEK